MCIYICEFVHDYVCAGLLYPALFINNIWNLPWEGESNRTLFINISKKWRGVEFINEKYFGLLANFGLMAYFGFLAYWTIFAYWPILVY